MREVEFLPDWYPKVRARKRVVAIQAWATLILVCALGGWTLFIQRNLHARQVELSSLRSDLRQSETEIERLVELLKLDQALSAQDQINMKIGTPMPTTRVVTLLEQIMPRDMALLSLDLDTIEPPKPVTGFGGRAAQNKVPEPTSSRLSFKLRGVAPTDVDLAEFLTKLTARPFFKQVELIYSHEKQDAGHVLREFELAFVLDLTGIERVR